MSQDIVSTTAQQRVPDAVQLALGQCITSLWNADLVRHDVAQHALFTRLCQLLLKAAAEDDRRTVERVGRELCRGGWRPAAILAWEMGRELRRKRAVVGLG